MSVFASREGAEEFVEGNPFVLEGVVRAREWHEILPGPMSRRWGEG